MPVEIKELLVKVVVTDAQRKSNDEIDGKLNKLKAEILKSCKKMIGGRNHGR